MNIRDLFDHNKVVKLEPGEVAEFHQSPANFVDDWRELLGLPNDPFSDGRYVGLVHCTGAVLIQVDTVRAER